MEDWNKMCNAQLLFIQKNVYTKKFYTTNVYTTNVNTTNKLQNLMLGHVEISDQK